MGFLARTHLSRFSPTSAFAAICVWVTNFFLSAFEIRLLFWKRNRHSDNLPKQTHTDMMHLIRLTYTHKPMSYVNLRCIIMYLDKWIETLQTCIKCVSARKYRHGCSITWATFSTPLPWYCITGTGDAHMTLLFLHADTVFGGLQSSRPILSLTNFSQQSGK